MSNEIRMLELATQCIVSKKAIPLTTPEYRAFAEKLYIRQVNSSNHGALAALDDLTNLVNGHRTVLERPAQEAKTRDYTTRWLCDREAYCHGEYLVWNLEFLRGAREIWKALGDLELARLCQQSILAMLGGLGLGGLLLDVKSLRKDELQRIGPPGPKPQGRGEPSIITADGKPDRKAKGLPGVTGIGPRSANTKAPKGSNQRYWRHWYPAPHAYALAQALNPKRKDSYGAALRKRGLAGDWLTPEERDVLRLAMSDDPDAVMTVLRWVLARPPKDRFRILRTKVEVVTLNLDGSPSSTARGNGKAIKRQTGVQLFLCCESGSRDAGGGNDSVQEVACRVAEDFRSAVAQRVNKSLPPAVMPLSGSERSLDVEFGGREPAVVRASPRPYTNPTTVEFPHPDDDEEPVEVDPDDDDDADDAPEDRERGGPPAWVWIAVAAAIVGLLVVLL